jgi:hypothetical protein
VTTKKAGQVRVFAKLVPYATGEVAEWSIAMVLKTIEPQGSGGSNPSLSATVHYDMSRALRIEIIGGIASRDKTAGYIQILIHQD